MAEEVDPRMTKLVFVRMAATAKVKPRRKAMAKGPNGRSKPTAAKRVSRAGLFTLDAQSPKFGEELEEAFVRNVRKARRENKRG